jgi:hypothetical protein
MKQINIDGFYVGNNSIVFRPVDCVAVTNINIKNLVGSVITNVLVNDTTRVLLTAQEKPVENGIYTAGERTVDLSSTENGYGLIAYDINLKKFWLSNAAQDTEVDKTPINFNGLGLHNLDAVLITNPVNNQSLTFQNDYWVNTTYKTQYIIPFAEVNWVGNKSYTLNLNVVNVWYKISPTTTLTNNNALLPTNKFLSDQSARINYTGNASYFNCKAIINLVANNSSQNVEVAFAVNGAIINETIINMRLLSNNLPHILSLAHIFTLNNNYIEVYMRGLSSTNAIYGFYNFSLIIQECIAYY